MVIYGTAIISCCYFLGMLFGNLLGELLGIHTNLGGVGFAMLFLMLILNEKQFNFNGKMELGIKYWSEMYIPVTIAMTATQSVYKALNGGMLALVIGLSTVCVGFLLIPVLNKIGIKDCADS